MKNFCKVSLVALLCCTLWSCSGIDKGPRGSLEVGKSGWTLWLDQKAEWENDELYVPPVDVSKLSVASPTCGWDALYENALPATEAKKALDADRPINVTVPGTVEGYFWDALSPKGGLGETGNYLGVSWWNTKFTLPSEFSGKRLKLAFTEGVHQRAEIFINGKLVGYELAHQLPFDVDVTRAVVFGEENKLSVRITDAGGNFGWGDYVGFRWGKYWFPLSHGFGGILGKVELKAVAPVHVSDVFVKNKPSLKDVDVEMELTNEGEKAEKLQVAVAVEEAWKNGKSVSHPKTIYSQQLGEIEINPSEKKVLTASANVPEARLWEIKNSNLYNWVTTVTNEKGEVVDMHRQRFGFRFLEVIDHNGENPRFYFNGKRTTLISAISWGFWPVNGVFPTKELAHRHIQSALDLGMNMLNCHRCRGNELLFNTADEMGILYYQEPGGFSSHRSHTYDEEGVSDYKLGEAISHQRVLRMVKTDRNHPSIVYYNMVNEPGWTPDEKTKQTMVEAHKIDPTRFKSYGSGFMPLDERLHPNKIHLIPNDPVLHEVGYCDMHNAGNSPGVYVDDNYNSKEDYRRNEKGNREIYVWGEEAALASPPQVELIAKEKKSKDELNGWDGADYADWIKCYNEYLEEKGLKKNFPSVTDLITSMANVQYYEHGRFLENARITDDFDIYVYNGYEDMKLDNFSGCVDIYRHIKGNPELLKQYARPLYVAVKLHNKMGEVNQPNLVDLFVINEQVLNAGDYEVKLYAETPSGKKMDLGTYPVQITGGDKFSDFVAENISVPFDDGAGYYNLKAELLDKSGKKLADGHDEAFVVDWKENKLSGKGAVMAFNTSPLVDFIKELGGDAEAYKKDLGHLDYVCLGHNIDGFYKVASLNFVGKDKVSSGLNLDYFRGKAFDFKVDSRLSKVDIDFNQKDKLIPGYDILGTTDFSLRWEGYLKADVEGKVKFKVRHDDGARVWIDDKLMVDNWNDCGTCEDDFTLDMKKGEMYKVKIEAYQNAGEWDFSLLWELPNKEAESDMDNLLRRVKDEGTVMFLLEDVENWMKDLKERGIVSYETYYPGSAWVGSTFFVKDHPFFEGLPTNCAMNWEYQDMVRYDATRHFGFWNMKGEEPVACVVGSPFHRICTSVGILPYGKGKIVFSSFNLLPAIKKTDAASSVPKKVLANYLRWAEK